MITNKRKYQIIEQKRTAVENSIYNAELEIKIARMLGNDAEVEKLKDELKSFLKIEDMLRKEQEELGVE